MDSSICSIIDGELKTYCALYRPLYGQGLKTQTSNLHWRPFDVLLLPAIQSSLSG